MGRVLPIASNDEPVLACNNCGGVEHGSVFSKSGYELVRCVGCSLVFVANPPQWEEARPLCVSATYGDWIDTTALGPAATRRLAREHLRSLRRTVGERRGLRLFAVGHASGPGLAEPSQRGFEAFGEELSIDSPAFARRQVRLEVHAGDWRDAGHAEGSFDVVTLFDVIERLSDPLGELTSVRRLLRPGGWLLQSTSNIDGLFPRLSYRLAHRLDYWPHPELPRRRYQFSDRTLAELTERAGYEVTRVDQSRIPLGYSFGTPRSWWGSPGLFAYAALFAPIALIGPWLGMGDRLYLSARRPE